MIKPCNTCDGCGQVASDEWSTPWTHWLSLPVQSSLAMQLGLVTPLICPDCGGSGMKEDKAGLEQEGPANG